MDARILLADAISKPSHCYGCMRGVLGHAAIGLWTACNAKTKKYRYTQPPFSDPFCSENTHNHVQWPEHGEYSEKLAESTHI